MNKKNNHSALFLALQFTLILTVAFFLAVIASFWVMNNMISSRRNRDLKRNAETIEKAIKGYESKTIQAGFPDLPRYISFTAYYDSSERIISTNDPFLPLFEPTGEKTVHHVEKDYYTDGDLNIIYFAKQFEFEEETVVVETATEIREGYAVRMYKRLSLTAVIILLPILILSFFASFLISKNALKKE